MGEETEQLHEEIRDLTDRLEGLERANRELEMQKEKLEHDMEQQGASKRVSTAPGPRSTMRIVRNTEEKEGMRAEESNGGFDDTELMRQKYRLLWQTAIHSTMVAHHKGKQMMLKNFNAILSKRSDTAIKEVNSLKLSLSEVKKVQEAQKILIDQKNEQISELRKKNLSDTDRLTKERARLEEEFNTQISSLQAQSKGEVGADSLAEGLQPATHQFGFDEAEGHELRERVEELEGLLEAAGDEEAELVARKEALEDRVAELEEQIAEFQQSGDYYNDGSGSQGVGSLAGGTRFSTVSAGGTRMSRKASQEGTGEPEDELKTHVRRLERELLTTQKAEREWREMATISWWSKFTGNFCVNARLPPPDGFPPGPRPDGIGGKREKQAIQGAPPRAPSRISKKAKSPDEAPDEAAENV